MGKTIVFCADGTWNGPGTVLNSLDIDSADGSGELPPDAITNVVKLFANLSGQVTAETAALHYESEKVQPGLQSAKYLHGVGDSSNLISKVLGGVFGIGVVARILRGYTYLSRTYLPGDAIHIVGFSRGAYTARALAGLIASVGLLDPSRYDVTDKALAYRRAFEAWLKSRQLVFANNGTLLALLGALTRFAEGAIVRLTLTDADFIATVPMASVAVWDTVGSMGIPDYIQGQRHDFFSFVNTQLSPRVARGFHAMALDERRRDFPVTRWDADARIEQRWFVGAHADVGGGYAANESGLSDLALDWMQRQLASVGVGFASPGPYVADLTHCAQATHTPWTQPPFDLAPQVARQPISGDAFDASVQQHWLACSDYQRSAWPQGFA